jgi:hypothetical protein
MLSGVSDVPGLPTHLIMQYQENILSGYIKSKV